MTETDLSAAPKPKRRSPTYTEASFKAMLEKRSNTREENRIRDGKPPKPPKVAKEPKTPRVIAEKPIVFLTAPKPALIKGASADGGGYKCHFAPDSKPLTLENLNSDEEYALRGKTFEHADMAIALKAAQKYQKENPGSFLTKIMDHHHADIMTPPKGIDGKKEASFGIPCAGAKKYLKAYLVTTPHKKAASKQMFDTLHLVK